MAERIKMTPQELNEGAKYLRDRLATINGEVAQLEQRINLVAGNWEGQAQHAFRESYDSLRPILKETLPQVIEAMSKKLDAAANTIRDADAQIASAFRG